MTRREALLAFVAALAAWLGGLAVRTTQAVAEPSDDSAYVAALKQRITPTPRGVRIGGPPDARS